jgi:hypothetical protein
VRLQVLLLLLRWRLDWLLPRACHYCCCQLLLLLVKLQQLVKLLTRRRLLPADW